VVLVRFFKLVVTFTFVVPWIMNIILSNSNIWFGISFKGSEIQFVCGLIMKLLHFKLLMLGYVTDLFGD
jgi:hypothetical protein